MQLVFSILYNFEMFQKILFSPENPNFVVYMIQYDVGHPGLLTKDETSETIVGIVFVLFLAVRVPCWPKWLISVINHYINLQNTQLSAKTKNRHIFIVLGSLVSSFLSNPVFRKLEIHT